MLIFSPLSPHINTAHQVTASAFALTRKQLKKGW